MEATYIVYGNQENVLMLGTAKEVSVTVFLKDEQPKYFFQVSTIEINDEWLKVCYFDRFGKKKSVANFRVDNPNFIGYTAAAPEFDEEEL